MAELAVAAVEDRAAIIARAAEARDSHGQPLEPLCLAALDLFLTYYGRMLGAAALTFLPYAGLYIAGGILPKLSWRLASLSLPEGTVPEPRPDGAGLMVDPQQDPLLAAYLDQGPKMSGTVAGVPLWLLDDPDAGVKGCLYRALQV